MADKLLSRMTLNKSVSLVELSTESIAEHVTQKFRGPHQKKPILR